MTGDKYGIRWGGADYFPTSRDTDLLFPDGVRWVGGATLRAVREARDGYYSQARVAGRTFTPVEIVKAVTSFEVVPDPLPEAVGSIITATPAHSDRSMLLVRCAAEAPQWREAAAANFPSYWSSDVLEKVVIHFDAQGIA
jgi:hypothetical protein